MVLRGGLGSKNNLDKEVKLFHGKDERTEGGESKSKGEKCQVDYRVSIMPKRITEDQTSGHEPPSGAVSLFQA